MRSDGYGDDGEGDGNGDDDANGDDGEDGGDGDDDAADGGNGDVAVDEDGNADHDSDVDRDRDGFGREARECLRKKKSPRKHTAKTSVACAYMAPAGAASKIATNNAAAACCDHPVWLELTWHRR